MSWSPGDQLVRREIWRGRPWCGTVVIVIEDSPAQLVTYLPERAPFGFPEGDWPGGLHPWHGRGGWEGHGVLMVQRPGESYAVWHFWHGPDRSFSGWYLNLQEPFRRTTVGYDTQDLELDIWWPVGGEPVFKDEELLEERVRDGRFTRAETEQILELGMRIRADLDAHGPWWADWTAWRPDPTWGAPELPPGWETAPLLAG